MAFNMDKLVLNLVGPVDGNPVGDAISVVVTVLSCGRLDFSREPTIPVHSRTVSVTGIWGGLHSTRL